MYYAQILEYKILETLIYLNQILPHNNINKLRSISCRHLGTSLLYQWMVQYIHADILVMMLCFDDDKLSIGDIYHGFDKDALEKFVKNILKLNV